MFGELLLMYILYKLDQSSRSRGNQYSRSHDNSEYDHGWGSFDPHTREDYDCYDNYDTPDYGDCGF